MAYEKQTWKTGDVITQEKLNHMEDGISTGGGIYSYGSTTYFDGEVTTTSQSHAPFATGGFPLFSVFPETDIEVELNGQKYALPYGYYNGARCWGEIGSGGMPSFENYPLFIHKGAGEEVSISTPNAGTYSLKIKAKVVAFTTEMKYQVANTCNFVINIDALDYKLDKTWEEIYIAFIVGSNIIVKDFSQYPVKYLFFYTCYMENNEYFVKVIDKEKDIIVFHTTSTDGYPVYMGQ